MSSFLAPFVPCRDAEYENRNEHVIVIASILPAAEYAASSLNLTFSYPNSYVETADSRKKWSDLSEAYRYGMELLSRIGII